MTYKTVPAVPPSNALAHSIVDPCDFKPGRYRHYMGGLYVATHLVYHHETRVLMVNYLSMLKCTYNVREYAELGKDSWTDVMVDPNGAGLGTVLRFTYLGATLEH